MTPADVEGFVTTLCLQHEIPTRLKNTPHQFSDEILIFHNQDRFRSGPLLFNDTSSQVIVFTVELVEQVEPILAGLSPLFNTHSAEIFVTDEAASRHEHFAENEEDGPPDLLAPIPPSTICLRTGYTARARTKPVLLLGAT